MTSRQAVRKIHDNFPGIKVASIGKAGEGLDNVAFLVNGTHIFRFPKIRSGSPLFRMEVAALRLARQTVRAPIPVPEYVGTRCDCLGYRKIEGAPLLLCCKRLDSRAWRRLARQVGEFMSEINSVSPARAWKAGLKKDEATLDDWFEDAQKAWKRLRRLVPKKMAPRIERFLGSPPPSKSHVPLVCHNDLGIEHILVTPESGKITGIIDWGDSAISDPAGDFGRLYRDLGPDVLDAILRHYRISANSIDALRDRAAFSARCSIFEDLRFGKEWNHPEYVQKGIRSLRILFRE